MLKVSTFKVYIDVPNHIIYLTILNTLISILYDLQSSFSYSQNIFFVFFIYIYWNS